MTRRSTSATLVLCLLAVSGCSEPIYHGLSEREANQMLLVLDERGIGAEKSSDGQEDGRWVIAVDADEVVAAHTALQREGLPRRHVAGFDDFYPAGGLVPTQSEERVVFQYSTAQELTGALLRVDGVVDAQVNLVLPEKPVVRLAGASEAPPRASVLIKVHSVDEPPISSSDVARLVSGGVDGLAVDAVEVIYTDARSAPAAQVPEQMVAIGPLRLASGSRAALQVLLGVMSLTIICLAAALVWTTLRTARAEHDGEEHD